MDAKKVYIVIPNWNGADWLEACLNSLKAQTFKHYAVVVDNGSSDNSVKLVERYSPEVHLILRQKNYGYTGGVNPGIEYVLDQGGEYVALLNNDAVADKDWLKHLVEFLDKNPKAGIVTSKICDDRKSHLDSTGDIYTTWGLPYPRGRGETDLDAYNEDTWVFGASGGASLYRIKMLEQIGLFDQDFFAYYEDVDISFRAQLAGWKVGYEPKAEVYHEISATSRSIKGFATFHTLKNLPLLFWKNVPGKLMLQIYPRFLLVYLSITLSALSRGQIIPVIKGWSMAILLWPKKLLQRRKIQRTSRVTTEYISSIITHDLPPNASKLRRIRSIWWMLQGKST